MIKNFLASLDKTSEKNQDIDHKHLEFVIYKEVTEDFASCLHGLNTKISLLYSNLENIINGNPEIVEIRNNLLEATLNSLRSEFVAIGKLKIDDTEMQLHQINGLRKLLGSEKAFKWIDVIKDDEVLTKDFIDENKQCIVTKAKIKTSSARILDCLAEEETEKLLATLAASNEFSPKEITATDKILIDESQGRIFSDLQDNFLDAFNSKYNRPEGPIDFSDLVTKTKDSYVIEDIHNKLKYFIARALLPQLAPKTLIAIYDSEENENMVIKAIGNCYFFISRDTEDLHQTEKHKKLHLRHIMGNILNSLPRQNARDVFEFALSNTKGDADEVINFFNNIEIREFLIDKSDFIFIANDVLSKIINNN